MGLKVKEHDNARRHLLKKQFQHMDKRILSVVFQNKVLFQNRVYRNLNSILGASLTNRGCGHHYWYVWMPSETIHHFSIEKV